MDKTEREAFIAGLIGRSYAFGGDGPREFDCYGLVAYVQRHCFNRDLPDIDRSNVAQTTEAVSRKVAHGLLNNPARKLWRRIDDPNAAAEGDIALMGNVDGRNYHIGTAVFLGRNFVVLHAEHPAGVTWDDVPSLRVKGYNRITFFRRG